MTPTTLPSVSPLVQTRAGKPAAGAPQAVAAKPGAVAFGSDTYLPTAAPVENPFARPHADAVQPTWMKVGSYVGVGVLTAGAGVLVAAACGLLGTAVAGMVLTIVAIGAGVAWAAS